ncbi:MAG: hypothetical protein IT165_31045 [Bryobacterales bacterium]|nr:hypothetical protein [Bryobacterales bacterium]
MTPRLFALFLLLLAAAPAQTDTRAFEKRLEADLAQSTAEWHAWFTANYAKDQTRQGEGYGILGMARLHARTKDPKYLRWAKEEIHATAAARRPIHPFHAASFIEAYIYFRPSLPPADRTAAEELIRLTLRGQYALPDWGAHNRSLIGAAGFYRAVQAMPKDPEAGKWRGYAEALASESWGHWSVEDASLYQPLWMMFLLDCADSTGRQEELMAKPTTRYYFDYYRQLQMPGGMMPDFGDGEWSSMWQLYVAVLVRASSAYHNGEYLYAAERLYDYWRAQFPLGGYGMLANAQALKWLDPGVETKPFRFTRSAEALEDLIGKKIVFRNPAGAYLLLNYRDQGPYGRYTRDHVNQVLAAYEEKPHHGHADENSITSLMDDGTVLLGDGGYRPQNDYFGGWRADVFHNRLVAREGFPMHGDVFDFLAANKLYTPVETEKVHFRSFRGIDYSRTRLRDDSRGYTADRILLFFPSQGSFVAVDNIRITRAGHKTFADIWHPAHILKTGDGYVVSWPEGLQIGGIRWNNPHTRDLLVEFLDRTGKREAVKEITRRYEPSKTFYQFASNWYFEGQRLTFITVLRPHAAGTFDPRMLDEVSLLEGSHKEDRTLGLRVATADGTRFTIGLKLDQTIGMANRDGRPLWDWESGAVSYGPLRTDADFAYVSEGGPSGRHFGLMNATRLEWQGAPLFDMPETDVIYQGPHGNPVKRQKAKMPAWEE